MVEANIKKEINFRLDKDRFYRDLYRIFSRDETLDAIPLEELMETIPTVDQLDDVPPGTVVLVRMDLDVPVKDGGVADSSRIEASLRTLRFCIEKGWTTILFGHIGRDKDLTLAPVCRACSKLIGRDIEFISNWIDEERMKLDDSFVSAIKAAKPGSLFMLENTRKYDIERALWKAKEADFQGISADMYELAADFRERVTVIEINEAIAASNFDFSSAALPLIMSKTAMGFYLSEEMNRHILGARQADMLVMSGLKINKLDDLENVLTRKSVKRLVVAGSLAMALKKAKAQFRGGDFCIGKAETDEKAKYYISPQRIEQGKRIIALCEQDGVEVILPVDFVLDNGETSEEIPPGFAQFDVGPKTRKLISKKIADYIAASKKTTDKFTMFYNGVFGKFEDPRFEAGTREFIALLKKMTAAGISTYVGGGEGRLALLKYGSLTDVAHAFTAGGTILKSLSNRHIAFLKAMCLQNSR
ncbi:MAG: phosphoglycerate kinase [Candidatus Aminicenantes bacterium]|nr:phosphoglycerate kinase [Candidatus Aminicenantes bacterium]